MIVAIKYFFTQIHYTAKIYYNNVFYYLLLNRPKDVGRPKAEVAAEFVNKRIHACNVVPYPLRIK